MEIGDIERTVRKWGYHKSRRGNISDLGLVLKTQVEVWCLRELNGKKKTCVRDGRWAHSGGVRDSKRL